MPYFDVATTRKLTTETKTQLQRELGRLIELIPGKSEQWLMTQLRDEACLSFAGSNEEPAAVVTLKTFGELKPEQYDLLTAEICSCIQQLLQTQPSRIYVMYEPVTHWGWNSSNF